LFELNIYLDRPKNDKAIILTKIVHMLNELTAEVNMLKIEHKALSEESHKVRFLLV